MYWVFNKIGPSKVVGTDKPRTVYVKLHNIVLNYDRRPRFYSFLRIIFLDTCNTIDSMRKAATCRRESYMRHVVCRIFTYVTLHDMSYVMVYHN